MWARMASDNPWQSNSRSTHPAPLRVIAPFDHFPPLGSLGGPGRPRTPTAPAALQCTNVQPIFQRKFQSVTASLKPSASFSTLSDNLVSLILHFVCSDAYIWQPDGWPLRTALSPVPVTRALPLVAMRRVCKLWAAIIEPKLFNHVYLKTFPQYNTFYQQHVAPPRSQPNPCRFIRILEIGPVPRLSDSRDKEHEFAFIDRCE